MSVPASIQQLVDGSGNTFHAKVARWLQSDKWHIRVSPYYMDQTQNKAREIDLIAERHWPMTDDFGRWCGDVVVRLFIECKFVPSHAVFWFTEKDMAAAEALVCRVGGFRSNNTYTNSHHYLSTCARVAKVFASETNKGQDFEPFYKALNQVLNAQVSMRRRRPFSLQSNRASGAKLLVIDYPVVVCSSFDKLYATDFYDDIEPAKIPGNFQLEVQYAYFESEGTHKDDYFLVDFVEFSRLPELSALIAKDAEVAAYLSR